MIRRVAAAIFLALLLAACAGGDGPDTATAPDAEEPTSAAADAAAEDPVETPVDAVEDSPDEAATPTEAAAGDSATAAGSTTADGDAQSASSATSPAGGIDGCPDQTALSATRVSLDFPDDEVLPQTTFTGGHFVMDLDGSGFGPTLAGVLSSDPAADAVALADEWASPGSPAAGAFHVVILLEGPPVGAAEYPLGVYGVTFSDNVFSPTEGMGLSALDLYTDDGGQRPMNRDNQLELTHFGDGVICGTITSTGRQPESSNPVTNVEGAFAATLAEQP